MWVFGYKYLMRASHFLNLDSKGRLSIPAKVRAILEEEDEGRVVLTADLDRNLLMYTASQWEITEAKLEKLSSFNQTTRRIKQLYLGYASDCELDSAGRILIPPALRKFAFLDKQVALNRMGSNSKWEIWDLDRWNAQAAENIEFLQGEDLSKIAGLEDLSL